MEEIDYETGDEALLVRFGNPEVNEFCRWDEYHPEKDILHNNMISLINRHVSLLSQNTHHGIRGQGQGQVNSADGKISLQHFNNHEQSSYRYTAWDIEVIDQIEKTVMEERENAFKYTSEDIELMKITERKVKEERRNAYRYASEDIEIMKQVERKVQEEREIARKRHLNELKDAVPVKRSRLQGCTQSFTSNKWNDGVFGCPEVNQSGSTVQIPLSTLQQNTYQENSQQCWSQTASMLDSKRHSEPTFKVEKNLHGIINNTAYFDKRERGQLAQLKDGFDKLEGQFAYTFSEVHPSGCQTVENEMEVKQYQFEKKRDILNQISELQQPLKESPMVALDGHEKEKTNSRSCSSIALFDGEKSCQGPFSRLRCKDRSNEDMVLQGNKTRIVQVVKGPKKYFNTQISDQMKNREQSREIVKNNAKQNKVRKNNAGTKHNYKQDALKRDLKKYSVQIKDVDKSNTQHKVNYKISTLNKSIHTNATGNKDIDYKNTQKHTCMNDTQVNKDAVMMTGKIADRRKKELEATTKHAEKRKPPVKRFVIDIGELETFGQVSHKSTYSAVKKVESELLAIRKTFSVATDSTDTATKKRKLGVKSTLNSVPCGETKASKIKIPGDKIGNPENQIIESSGLNDTQSSHNIKFVRAGNLEAKSKMSGQDDLTDKMANPENKITQSIGLAGTFNNFTSVGAGNLEVKTKSSPETDLAYAEVNSTFKGGLITKKATLKTGLTTHTGGICPVSGCHGYRQQSLKEHAFSEHLPELFRESNTVDVDKIKTIHRKRMSALGKASSWILKTKDSLDGLVRFFNRGKKMPNICIADSVETMKRFCLLNGWYIPSSFTTRPINCVSVLLHWHVLLHCVKYLSVQQRKTFKTLFVKNTKPKESMQVKQTLDTSKNTIRKALQSNTLLVNGANFDYQEIACLWQKGPAALADKNTPNDTSRKELQSHPLLVNDANFDNQSIICQEQKVSTALMNKSIENDTNKQGTRSLCKHTDAKEKTQKKTERESKNKINQTLSAEKENKSTKIQVENDKRGLTSIMDSKLKSNGSNDQPSAATVNYRNQSNMEIHTGTLNIETAVDTFTHLNKNTGIKPTVFVTVDMVQSSGIQGDVENENARRISNIKGNVNIKHETIERAIVDYQSQGIDRKDVNIPLKHAIYDTEVKGAGKLRIKQEQPVLCGVKEKSGDNCIASSEQKETEKDLSKPLSSQCEKRELKKKSKAKNDVGKSADINMKGNVSTHKNRDRRLIKVDVFIQHDKEDVSIQHDEVDFSIHNEKEAVSIQRDEVHVSIPQDEVDVSNPHDEVDFSLQHDIEAVSNQHDGVDVSNQHFIKVDVSNQHDIKVDFSSQHDGVDVSSQHDGVDVSIQHDEVDVSSQHDEVDVSIQHDEEDVSNKHEVDVSLQHDEVDVSIQHDEVVVSIHHDEVDASNQHDDVDVSFQHDKEDSQLCKSIPINQPLIHTQNSLVKTCKEIKRFIEIMQKQHDVIKTEEPKGHRIENDKNDNKDNKQRNTPCEQNSLIAVQSLCKSEVKKQLKRLPENMSDCHVKEKVRKQHIDVKIMHHDNSFEPIPFPSSQTTNTSQVHDCNLLENETDIVDVVGKDIYGTEEPYIVYVCPCGKMDTNHDVVFDHFIDHEGIGTIDVVDIGQDKIGFAGEQIEPPETVTTMNDDDDDCVILENSGGHSQRKNSKQHVGVRSDRNVKTPARARTYFENCLTKCTHSVSIENKARKSLSRMFKDDLISTRQNARDKHDINQTSSTSERRNRVSERNSVDMIKKDEKPQTYNKANRRKHGSTRCTHYKKSVYTSTEKGSNNKTKTTLKQNSTFSKIKLPESVHEKVKGKARKTFKASYKTPATERTKCRRHLRDGRAETEKSRDAISNVTQRMMLYTGTTKSQTSMNVSDERGQLKINRETIWFEKKEAGNDSRKKKIIPIKFDEKETTNKTSSVFDGIGSKKLKIKCDETGQDANKAAPVFDRIGCKKLNITCDDKDANKASSIRLHPTIPSYKVGDEQNHTVQTNDKNRPTGISNMVNRYKLKHLDSFNGQALWVDGNSCPVKGCHGHTEKFKTFTSFDIHWRLYHIPVLITKQCSICREENWRKYNMKKHIHDQHGGSGMLIKKEMQNRLYIDPCDTTKYLKQREWMYD